MHYHTWVKLSIIKHIFLLMYLLSQEISIRVPKNACKVSILNIEGLALNGPMKDLGWAVDIKNCIELSYDLLIPITVEGHDWWKIHSSTSIFYFPYHWQINFKQIILVDGFHLGGGMRFAKDHGGIPICMKIHPKADIPLLLLGKTRWIFISSSI
jgi:hypothetical protein